MLDALSELPDPYREAVAAVDVAGLSYAEAAGPSASARDDHEPSVPGARAGGSVWGGLSSRPSDSTASISPVSGSIAVNSPVVRVDGREGPGVELLLDRRVDLGLDRRRSIRPRPDPAAHCRMPEAAQLEDLQHVRAR